MHFNWIVYTCVCVCAYPVSFTDAEMTQVVETYIVNIRHADDPTATTAGESTALVMTKYSWNIPCLKMINRWFIHTQRIINSRIISIVRLKLIMTHFDISICQPRGYFLCCTRIVLSIAVYVWYWRRFASLPVMFGYSWHKPIVICILCHAYWCVLCLYIMTSSNGNIFRVTGHLCGEFTGHRWIPRTKASDAELWCFLWSAPE